ncbi:hypothetical protein L1987_15369 [Smallanthus sonchifolius]|uniref:Uncharacterized protein n=1 Tax=Smallanthus sonchifolius TaxID=185202 RepID=A0ACB9J7Y7_9ASTR|nr:hypothetical protein L1987_15369 [Smallanthus sonchifolius]
MAAALRSKATASLSKFRCFTSSIVIPNKLDDYFPHNHPSFSLSGEVVDKGYRFSRSNNNNNTRGLVNLAGGGGGGGDPPEIDTKDILFICGGAFIDLEKTISERRQDSSIGFGAPVRANMRTGGVTTAAVTSTLLETVESSDLIAYGLIPEFVGRFPILVNLLALTENQLVQIPDVRTDEAADGGAEAEEAETEAELPSIAAL